MIVIIIIIIIPRQGVIGDGEVYHSPSPFNEYF